MGDGLVGFVSDDVNQRTAARSEAQAPGRRLLPRGRERESERARAQLAQFRLARSRKSAARVEHAPCTPEHGRPPRETAVPLAQ